MKYKITFLVVWVVLALMYFLPCKQALAPNLTDDEAITLWVHKLATCESGNNAKAINPSDGGSRSVGYVQFKDSTWKSYVTRYKLDFTADDIFDGEKQVILATKMLLENPKNQNHWHNCSRKVGMLK